eukprot:scaffold50361_cov52-Attheya_sp.AAC.3
MLTVNRSEKTEPSNLGILLGSCSNRFSKASKNRTNQYAIIPFIMRMTQDNRKSSILRLSCRVQPPPFDNCCNIPISSWFGIGFMSGDVVVGGDWGEEKGVNSCEASS